MNVQSTQHVTEMRCVKIQLDLMYALAKKDIQGMASIVKVSECQFFRMTDCLICLGGGIGLRHLERFQALCVNRWLLRCKQV